MARFLAINWNSNVIRFVFGSAERDGVLRVLKAGERESESDETTDDAQVPIVERVTSLVQELKATKATLLLCVNRSVVDSVTFSVPPASTAELPTIVRNMALRQLTGVSEDSVINFVSYPSVESGEAQSAR